MTLNDINYQWREFSSSIINDYFTHYVKYVHHYTSPEGLLGIIQSKNMRFTEYSCLNDYTEGSLIYKLVDCIIENNFDNLFKAAIKKWIVFEETSNIELQDEEKKILQELNPFVDRLSGSKYFICCFSEDSDNLSLWNYYTKTPNSVGYNISFDITKLIPSIELNNKFKDAHIGMSNVIYDPKQQFEIVDKILNQAYKFWKEYENLEERERILFLVSGFLDFFRFVFKHPAFSHEKEFRVIVRMTQKDFDENILFNRETNSDGFIKLRNINGVFSPYIDMAFGDVKLINKITISPTLKDEQAKSSISLLLKKYDFETCDISSSYIPLKY